LGQYQKEQKESVCGVMARKLTVTFKYDDPKIQKYIEYLERIVEKHYDCSIEDINHKLYDDYLDNQSNEYEEIRRYAYNEGVQDAIKDFNQDTPFNYHVLMKDFNTDYKKPPDYKRLALLCSMTLDTLEYERFIEEIQYIGSTRNIGYQKDG